MILVKVHESVVAMCDDDLVGKRFEEGKRVLDVSERFYKGEELDMEEVKRILREGSNLNLVGKEIINVALKEKVINEEDVVYIEGVPHAQVYNFV